MFKNAYCSILCNSKNEQTKQPEIGKNLDMHFKRMYKQIVK